MLFLSNSTFINLDLNVEIMNLSNEFVVAAFNHEKFLKFEGAKISTWKYNQI